MRLLTGVLIAGFTSIAFSHEYDVTEFDLCMRNISSINEKSFVLKDAPPDTMYISLCNNDLLTIDAVTFQRFNHLESLNLNRNRRLRFPGDGSEFLQVKSLMDLQCFRCGVDTIFKRSLQGMPRLEQINLTENSIEDIEVKAFYANMNLESIDLRFNKLRRLPSEMLTPLVSIRRIDLSSNTELAPEGSEPFLISTVLEKLSCDECGFVTVQDYTFAKLPGLKELYLRRNKISVIHGLAFPQKALTSLMLEGNLLKSVDSGILNVMNLKICLDDNAYELKWFLKDLSALDRFICYNRDEVDTTTTTTATTTATTTTTRISTSGTFDATNDSIDLSTIPMNSRVDYMKNDTLGTTPKSVYKQDISYNCISGYLMLICLTVIVTFILLVGVWLKLKQKDTTPGVAVYMDNIDYEYEVVN